MTKLKIISGDIADPYKLASGSVGLNRALEGGFMGGRIHVFWGPKGSGKTTQALMLGAEAQRLGKTLMYVDAEKTYSAPWAKKCGVDVHALQYVRGNAVEDILTTILPPIEKEEVDIAIIDSLSSIFVEGYLDDPNYKGIGISARSANFLTSKILNSIGLNTQIILIAHGNMASAGQGMSLQAKISKSVEHWASTIVKFRLGMGKEDTREEDKSKKIYWKIEKSKQSLYPVEGQYWMTFAPTATFIDQATEVAELACETGIADKRGAWIKYEDEQYQGDKKFAAAIKSDEKLFAKLVEQLNSVQIEAVEDDEDAFSEGM